MKHGRIWGSRRSAFPAISGGIAAPVSSAQVRFVVEIDTSWSVTFTCEQDASWSTPARRLERLSTAGQGSFPAPLVALHRPDVPHGTLEAGAAVADIEALYRAILTRSGGRDEIEIFGHYLFDALLGPDLWAEMQQHTEALGKRDLELALLLPDVDSKADGSASDLHRLNWELMRSDADALVAGTPKLGVAITRLVKTPMPVSPDPLNVPPRILFVVGTGLAEEKIRPGAELHGLIRQARGGRAMRYRVLEHATPRVIQQVVQAFEPEIVHFVCHGGVDVDTGRVYLELETDEEGADPRRYAGQLLNDLRFGDSLPTIVVLSACMTAGQRYVVAGGAEAAPLAVSLVKGGIPIVLGMAGRVADITSRLFARRFGEAIVKGEPLVVATAEARKVAFHEGRDAVTTADWSFPAVFLANDVDSDYTPVQREQSDELWERIENWITIYGLTRPPVFCGREEFSRTFHQLFETPGAVIDERNRDKRVLVAFTKTAERGYGRTRLLQELGAQALRDGHVPVLLTFDEHVDFPKELGELVHAFSTAISTLRHDVLDVGESHVSQLELLASAMPSPQLDQVIQSELNRSHGLTPRAVSRAIRVDLTALLADTKQKIPFFRDAGGQAVVLLDDVDRYGDLVPLFFARQDGLVNATGFGTPEQPVPVVMTASLGGEHDARLRQIWEQRELLSWLATETLDPFRADGEDLIAYELVLLNPFAPDLLPGVSDVGWAFNDEVADEVRDRWRKRFRRSLKGMPQRFLTDVFYVLADTAHDDQFTIPADDDVWLARIARRQ